MLVLAGLGGMWLGPRDPSVDVGAVALLVGMVLLIAAVQSMFYIEGRHRLTMEPILAMIAGCGARRLWGSVAVRKPAP